MIKPETTSKTLSTDDLLKIEEQATQLMGIAKILSFHPIERISALAIAAGATAASLGVTKSELIELVTTYYDKTDIYLTKIEEAAGKSTSNEVPPKKNTDLN